MPRVADYTIIADGWVIEADQDTVQFEVPSNIATSSRAILGFMLDVDNLDDMTLTLRLNGIKVWTWNYSGGSHHPVRFFQEVIGGGVARAGTNVLSIGSSSGEKRFVQLSDIVLWWQADI